MLINPTYDCQKDFFRSCVINWSLPALKFNARSDHRAFNTRAHLVKKKCYRVRARLRVYSVTDHMVSQVTWLFIVPRKSGEQNAKRLLLSSPSPLRAEKPSHLAANPVSRNLELLSIPFRPLIWELSVITLLSGL